jgi:hypothetical protein
MAIASCSVVGLMNNRVRLQVSVIVELQVVRGVAEDPHVSDLSGLVAAMSLCPGVVGERRVLHLERNTDPRRMGDQHVCAALAFGAGVLLAPDAAERVLRREPRLDECAPLGVEE